MPDSKTVDTKQKERGERQNATEIKDSRCLRIGGDSEDFPFLLRRLKTTISRVGWLLETRRRPHLSARVHCHGVSPRSHRVAHGTGTACAFPRLLCWASSAASPSADSDQDAAGIPHAEPSLRIKQLIPFLISL